MKEIILHDAEGAKIFIQPSRIIYRKDWHRENKNVPEYEETHSYICVEGGHSYTSFNVQETNSRITELINGD